MNVAELREMLDGLPDDTEVRIAQQPNWPFEYSIADVVIIGGELGATEEHEDDEPVVYLVEGTQLGYLPGHVSRELGWR
jgi:hypothetical protein